MRNLSVSHDTSTFKLNNGQSQFYALALHIHVEQRGIRVLRKVKVKSYTALKTKTTLDHMRKEGVGKLFNIYGREHMSAIKQNYWPSQ